MAELNANLDLPFERWLECAIAGRNEIFLKTLPAYENWWKEDEQPATTTTYLTRFFTEIETITADMPDEDCGQLLEYLILNGYSGHMAVLMDFNNGVRMEDRVACIQSIFFVFEKLFFKRCPSPYSEGYSSNKLRIICFMWWDAAGIYGHPGEEAEQAADDAVFEVIEKTLCLDSDACRRSALHGLNEWQFLYPQRVKDTVQRFLHKTPNLHPRLIEYAERSARGANQ